MIGDTARQCTARRARLLATVLFAGAAASLLGGAPAEATRDCAYNSGTGVVTVTITGPDVGVTIRHAAGGVLEVTGSAPAGGTDTCSDVALSSVASISVVTNATTGSDEANQTLTLDLFVGTFTPGNSLEGGAATAPEVEINVDLGGGPGDKLVVNGNASAADKIVLGVDGINLNSDEGEPADADLTIANSVEAIEFNGLGGDDVITAGGGLGTGLPFNRAFTVSGGNGSDQLTGGAGGDMLVGGDGNDTLVGGDGNDTFDEGSAANGADRIEGGDGADDSVTYGTRSAPVRISIDDAANDGATGESDNVDVENLRGGEGDDTLSGTQSPVTPVTGVTGVQSAPNNEFYGGDGGDTTDGVDTVTYSDRSDGFTIAIGGTATKTGETGGESDVIDGSIDNIVGSTGNDTITGDVDDNKLDGHDGVDKLRGGNGNDTLIGGAGNDDELNGGGHSMGGADVLDFSGTTAVKVDLAAGTAADKGAGTGVGSDTAITNIERVIGSPQGDELTGNSLANTLDGGDGNDTLRGGDGNDTLNGGNDADNLAGEVGDDTQSGGGGTDTLDFSGRTSLTNLVVTFSATAGSGTTTGDDDAATGDDGFSSIESVVGTPNNDTFQSNATADVFHGGTGVDTADYTVATASVTINLQNQTAGHGGDSFSGIEKAVGGSGNDIIKSSSGNDVIDGGGGTGDTVDFSLSSNGVTVTLPSSATGHGTDTLSNVENVIGTEQVDDLGGDSNANRLEGRGQDDSLLGNTGDDVLLGGDGNDNLSGEGHGTSGDTIDFTGSSAGVTVNVAAGTATGQGEDAFVSIENVIGSNHLDRITGDGTINTLSGQGGNDEINGGGGNDTLNGGTDNDTLIGAAGKDELNGDAGDDTLRSGAGGTATAVENLNGGTGSDTADYSDASAVSGTTGLTIDMTMATATLNTNTGDAAWDAYNSIENVTGSIHDDTITGNSDPNKLSGLAGNDMLYGGTGDVDDVLAGGLGNDELRGGTPSTTGDDGSDTADYTDSLTGVSVTVGASGTASGEGNDTLTSIENAVGSAYIDTLIGDANANVLKGNGDDDVVKGLGDNDTLDGGSGNDQGDYSGTTAVSVDLDITAPQVTGMGTDTLRDLEKLLGSNGNDTLLGDEHTNEILGGNGDDTINGRGGDDTLNGDTGANTVSYAGAPTGVTVKLALATPQVTGGYGTDTLTNFVNLVGSSNDDVLTGTIADNVLDGAGGTNDTVDYANATSAVTINLVDATQQSTGGAGNDTLTNFESASGSPFDDTFIGTSGDNVVTGGGHGPNGDTISYAGASGGVRVSLAVTAPQNTEGAGTDTITQIENIIGSPGQDTLIGDSGSNTLTGGNGDDALNGGEGNDTENGGAGNDLFDQGTTPNGSDVMNGGSNGAEGDIVNYSKRASIALVSFDGEANDGEVDEGDNVGADVEKSNLSTFEPTAPGNVQATAGDGLATVTWTAPANDGGSPITGYDILSFPDNKKASTGPEARSATITGLTNGVTYTFTVTATNSRGTGDASAPSNPVTPVKPVPPVDPTAGQGYAMLGNDGGVFNYGAAGNFGSIPGLGLKLNQPPIGMSYTPTGKGYWIVAQDGGIFSFGDAKFHGSMGGAGLNAPVLGMEPTPTGGGYWLFASDGGIFSFGDAKFFGSMGASKLNAAVIGMAATSTGKGYWLVAQDGGIFSFGDASFRGSMGNDKLNQPVFDMAPAADDAGYYLVARDGGVFAFGSAAGKFFGSAAPANPATVIGIGTTPSGNGYWIADRNGVVYAFGDAKALGDLRGQDRTVVGLAALPKQK